MSSRATRASVPEVRFEAYLDAVAAVLGHAGRASPMRAYCRGLLLPGERKNIELVAARLGSQRLQALHQSMHHVVAKAGWDDAALLAEVRRLVLPTIAQGGDVRYFTVNNIVVSKQGVHSVGVAKQFSGAAGEAANCQLAVSLWAGNGRASLPIAYRLFLPTTWADDAQRRRAAGVPQDIEFETTPAMALRQLRQACADGVPGGVVLADVGYGDAAEFRGGLEALGLRYMLGISPGTELWPLDAAGLTVAPPGGKRRRGSAPPTVGQHPASAQAFAAALPARAWRVIRPHGVSRGGAAQCFAAVRVGTGPAGFGSVPGQGKWLLAEWPAGKAEPASFWLSDLPATATLTSLAWTATSAGHIVSDCKELKQGVGLAHFEGRGWRGHHHHASLCIAAYGFIVSERCRFPAAQRYRPDNLATQGLPIGFRPRGSQ